MMENQVKTREIIEGLLKITEPEYSWVIRNAVVKLQELEAIEAEEYEDDSDQDYMFLTWMS